MAVSSRTSKGLLHASPWGRLPPRMRVLYVTSYHRTGGWLAEALAADRASEIVLEEAVGIAEGVSRLREELYDAVLVSHDPDQLDALQWVEGLRSTGSEEPIVILGEQSEPELLPLCFEVGADAYLCARATTTRALIWTVARAIERHRLTCENRRLAQAERQRLSHEQSEAERLLDEQRALIRDLESLRHGSQRAAGEVVPPDAEKLNESGVGIAPNDMELPERLVAHYRELLRAYVIMGSGNLSGDLHALADLLAGAGVTAQQTMQLHVHALEELVHGLGNRSTRHVMTRADLLALEIMIHLAEGYRRMYEERLNPPRQQLLPGIMPAA